MEYVVKVYETKDGRFPFDEWLNELKDLQARSKIRARLDRVRLGNLGKCDPVGDGIHELKIDFGPAYRIYFGTIGKNVILVLCANSKRRQQKDIDKAKDYFNDFVMRGKSNGKK